MMRKLLLFLSLLLAPLATSAQVGPSVNGPFLGPNWPRGWVPSPQEWQLWWTNKVDYYPLGIPIDKGGTGAITAIGAAANLGLMNNALPSATIFVGNASNVAASRALSGDCTLSNIGVITCISKPLANGQVWIGNASNVATAHTISGDCTLGNTGILSCVNSTLSVGVTVVTGGTVNGLAFTNATGKFANLATVANGVLGTDGTGLPAVSATLPPGLTLPSPTVTGTITGTGSATFGFFQRVGNLSQAAWSTAGIGFRTPAATYTDTTSNTTVGVVYINALKAPTLAFSNVTTATNVYNMYLEDPVAGTNATLSNKFALGVDSLSILGAVRSNGLAGVNCSGTPTSGFVSTNGIVTHC